MKKLTALLLAMSLCLALSACGAKETAPEAPEASAASTEGTSASAARRESTSARRIAFSPCFCSICM